MTRAGCTAPRPEAPGGWDREFPGRLAKRGRNLKLLSRILPGTGFRVEGPSTSSLVKLPCIVSVTLRKTMPSCSTTQACTGGIPLCSGWALTRK
ncbi:hypothetical protein NN561_004385 [Cricetulus griseus]